MAPIGDWNTQEDYDVSSVIIHISAYARVGFFLVINHKSMVMNSLKLKENILDLLYWIENYCIQFVITLPNCLFTGNKQTLDIIPKESGINVREELLKFHDTWYSSNIMALAILGKGIFFFLILITM